MNRPTKEKLNPHRELSRRKWQSLMEKTVQRSTHEDVPVEMRDALLVDILTGVSTVLSAVQCLHAAFVRHLQGVGGRGRRYERRRLRRLASEHEPNGKEGYPREGPSFSARFRSFSRGGK